MAHQLTCPRCGSRKYWVLRDGRRRCARCRQDWRPGRLPLRLASREWRDVVGWFVRGASADAIARETGVNRKRVLRALAIVRTAMLGEMSPERATDRPSRTAPAPAVRPAPVVGLRMAAGEPLAEVVAGLEAPRLVRAARRREPLAAALPDVAQTYTALAVRGRLYRFREDDALPAQWLAELGAFWAYLRRQLMSRGGVRRARLGLFLAEYSWRYRHRRVAPDEQVKQLLKMIGAPMVSRVGLSRNVDTGGEPDVDPLQPRNG